MNKLLLLLTISLWYGVQGFTRYSRIIPNALNVDVGGVRAVGLGHSSLTERRGSSSTANPFGLAVFNTDRLSGVADNEIWPMICDLDSDGDNISNKDELCDPECINIGGSPECTGDLTLTHPGFPDVDGVVDIPVNGEAETDLRFQRAHGWLMIFAWVILAPVGIAMPLIFKKGKSGFWFNYHQHLLGSCVAITMLSFVLLLIRFGFEPIEFAFEDTGNDFSKHVLVGLIVVIIAIIQPISGHCRPHVPEEGEEKTSTRMFWEFQHRWTGRLGLLLAFVAIYLGLPLVYDGTEAVGVVLIVLLLIAGLAAFIYVLGFREEVSKTMMNDGGSETEKDVDTKETKKTAEIADAEIAEEVEEVKEAEEVKEVEEDADLAEKL